MRRLRLNLPKLGMLAFGVAIHTFALGADAPSSLPQPLFVRGGFNGWGTSNALIDVGAGRYQARITIRPGYHGFKLGSANWGTEWTTGAAIAVGADTLLRTDAGAETQLFVRDAGSYLFTVDASSAAAPQLRIDRLGAVPAAGAGAADPHAGRTGLAHKLIHMHRRVGVFAILCQRDHHIVLARVHGIAG